MLKVSDALQLIIESIRPAPSQCVELEDALGALVAQEIVSAENSPPFDKSMMDGYAIQVAGITTGSVEVDIIGEVTAGQEATSNVSEGQAIRIMTGAPIPPGADAVIPIEQSQWVGPSKVCLLPQHELTAGRNIIRCGSNIKIGEEVLSAGVRIRPQEIALLAELGQKQILVHRQPRVAILATGDELVSVQDSPGPGQIRNSNALMLAAQVRASGAVAVVLGIARDDRTDLRAKIQLGLECDFLCLSGGVSEGKLDLVPSELEAAGVQQIFHKVAMKPGKPIWFGKREQASLPPCYVFGLPGNPVSSMVCFELFVRTALRRFQSVLQPEPKLVHARLQRDFHQNGDREVWFPSATRIMKGEVVVSPTGWKGSSDIRSTVEANSSACFPAGERLFHTGEMLQVLLWSGSELA